MNEQSELSENELAKAIERITSIRERECLSHTWYEKDVLALNLVLTAAKRSQDLQKKLDEANARSEMWAKSAGGFAGERDALEQSSREKDEKLTKLELHLAFWNATFSKYLSFEANGIKYIPIKQIVADFNKCDQFLNQQKEK